MDPEIYTAAEKADALSVADLQAHCRTAWAGTKILYYPVLDSTNLKARQLAEEGYPEGTVVLAEQQEAGRGRRGRSWASAAGTGIFMTLVLKPAIDPNNASMLTLVTALAVSAAIRRCSGKPAGIKWPNDIVMSGKKVCGILTEMSLGSNGISHIVVGIGINVQNDSFPEELSETATSLYLETGKYLKRELLIAEILAQFEHYYQIFLTTEDLGGLLEEYNANLVNLGRHVRVLDPKESFEGQAMGINPRGELLVDTREGRRPVSAGEVSVRGIYGYV